MKGYAIPGMPGIRRFKEIWECWECCELITVWVGRDEDGEEMFSHNDHQCSA